MKYAKPRNESRHFVKENSEHRKKPQLLLIVVVPYYTDGTYALMATVFGHSNCFRVSFQATHGQRMKNVTEKTGTTGT